MTLNNENGESESGDIDSALGAIFDEGETGEQSYSPDPERETGSEAKGEAAPPPAENEPYPNYWSPSMKDHFKTLPPEVKAYILETESKTSSIIGRVDNERRVGKQLNELLKPYAQEFNNFSNGLPMNEMRDMMRGLHTLAKGDNQAKINVIANLAKAYHVDLRAMLGGQNEVDNYQDRGYDLSQVLSPLHQEVQGVKQFIESFKAQQHAYVESVAEQEAYSAINDTQQFPFLRELSDPIADLVEAGYEIAEAYQIAVARSPEHFDRLIAQRVEAELQKKQSAFGNRNLKSQNLINAFAPDNGGKSAPSADLDERLAAIFDAGG